MAHGPFRQIARFLADHIVHREARHKRPTVRGDDRNEQEYRPEHKVRRVPLQDARYQLSVQLLPVFRFRFQRISPPFLSPSALRRPCRSALRLVSFLILIGFERTARRNASLAAQKRPRTDVRGRWCVKEGFRLCHVNKPCGHTDSVKCCTKLDQPDLRHRTRLLSVTIWHVAKRYCSTPSAGLQAEII